MNSLLLLGIGGVVFFLLLGFIFRKRKGMLLILFLLAAIAAWVAYDQYMRTNKDLIEVKADIKISAIELIQEYEKDDSAADRKYLGKILEVTGIVKEVTKDENGFYTIALGQEESLSSVRCSMDSVHKTDAANVASGSSATIRGACIGFNPDEMGLGSDVKLNRGVIISKKDN
jgi:hypothetical protein